MLLYCKFICSLWVERQIKALHQNQSQKPRNTHRRPLNSKYQSISPTFFFVKLASPFKHCLLELPSSSWLVWREIRRSRVWGSLCDTGVYLDEDPFLLKGLFGLRASIKVKAKRLLSASLYLYCCFWKRLA